ncbi:MAG TPA: hypothetical protein VGF69_07315 [Thermoanaerobaculia bacterium]|jgi:hypothetical protein
MTLKSTLRPFVNKLRYLGWVFRGKPSGDMWGFGKRARLREIGKRFGCATFVETGTLFGDTVDAMRGSFERVCSVELSRELYDRSVARFAGDRRVHLYHGDSGSVMPDVVRDLEGRALFWLDGHYSGPGTALGDSECPVVGELSAIERAARRDHCILIDDARLFGTVPDYPTIDEVQVMLRRINPRYKIFVEHDCIYALPPQ